MSEYDQYKFNELRGNKTDFNFAEIMQQASINEKWRNKTGLWTLLSAACNDAALQCYEKFNSIIKDTADVETCNIHSLKSIAKSVNAEFLVKDLNEDYDDEIMELIEKFSVKREIALYTNEIFHNSITDKEYGNIILRSSLLNSDVSIDLILKIKKYILDINGVLDLNLIEGNQLLSELLKYEIDGDEFLTKENLRYNSELYQLLTFNFDYIKDSKDNLIEEDILNQYYINGEFLNLNYSFKAAENDEKKYKVNEVYLSENGYFDFNFFIKNLTLSDIINNIYYHNYDDYKQFTTLKLLIPDDDKGTLYKINPFYLLINIIRQNYYNDGSVMLTAYLNEEKNELVSIKELIFNIVGSLFLNNDKYYNDFVKTHFYKLFYSALITNDIKKFYLINKNEIKFKNVNETEFTEEEFKDQLSKYINYSDTDKFIKENQILTFNYSFIRFAKFAAIMNKFFDDEDVYKSKDNDDKNLIKFYHENEDEYGSIIKFNFFDRLRNTVTTSPNEYDLINKIINGTDEEESYLNKISTYFTNICIKIQNIREEIKTIVQQYNFIGTTKAVNNILYDFFIKNYSKRENWGYVNLSSIVSSVYDTKLRSVDELVNGSLSGNFRKNDNFSINVIEYYDTTDYLNIESNLPDVKVGQRIIGYEELPSVYIGIDYLLASSLVNTPIYEDIYVPCSNFITEYNKRFWEVGENFIDNQNDISISNEKKFKELDKFYERFDETEFSASITKEKIIPFLHNLWKMFALSGISQQTELLDEYKLYRDYSNSLSSKKYFNIENTIFPTIAVQQNLENLVEVNKYNVKEILQIAKYYYQNVVEQISVYTKRILKHYDENGIPLKNSNELISFHGYSSKYDLSKRQLQYSKKIGKIYNINGPWVYSLLQKILYQKNLSETISLKFIKELLTDNFNNITQALITAYYNYLNLPMNQFEELFLNNHIAQFEADDYENNFVLFKKNEDDIFGELWIRMYNMPIALPLLSDPIYFTEKNDDNEDTYEEQKILNSDILNIQNKDILRQVFNNCVEFGVFNKTFWAFGKYFEKDRYGEDYQEYYQLVSFSYTMKNGRFSIDHETVKYYYTDEFKQRITHLNDFVGATYYEKLIKFVLFDNEKARNEIQEIIDEYYGDQSQQDNEGRLFITSYKPEFIIYSFDETTNELIKSNFSIKSETTFPMILDHFSKTYQNKKRIWKTLLNDQNFNILYMSLNNEIVPDGIFDYYWSYEKKQSDDEIEVINSFTKIYIQIIRCKFSNDGISLSEYKEPISFNAGLSPMACIEKFSDALSNHNKCYYTKNNDFVTEFTPFNFGYEFSAKLKNLLISHILGKLGVFELYDYQDEDEINGYNNGKKHKKLFNFKLLNEVFSEEWFKKYIKQNKAEMINNLLIDMIGYEQIINAFGHENDFEKAVYLSANYVPLPIRLINESDQNKIKIFGENGLKLNILTDDFIYSDVEERLLKFFKKAEQQFNYIELNNLNNFSKFSDVYDYLISGALISSDFVNILNQVYDDISETTNWTSGQIIEYFNDNFRKILENKNEIKFSKCGNDENVENEQLLSSLNLKYFINDELTVDDISNNLISFKNDFNLFKITKPLYEYLPIIKRCVVNKLKVSLIFENDTNISFLDDGVIDLDATCYISDAFEKDKKVGYGNRYTQTTYISWSGDETNGGNETFLIDVNKYFNDFKESKNDLYIDFDVCYHKNSQIIPENTYILVNWLGIEEKFKLKTYGVNDHACNTKSFAIKIDNKTKAFEIIYYSLYPVIKLNYNSNINNNLLETPNIEFGITSVSDDLSSLLKSNWKKTEIETIYYFKDETDDSLSLILLDNMYEITVNNDINIMKLYENILDKFIYLKKGSRIIRSSELTLTKGYFGINMNNLNKLNVNMNYVYYLNNKYLKEFSPRDVIKKVCHFGITII